MCKIIIQALVRGLQRHRQNFDFEGGESELKGRIRQKLAPFLGVFDFNRERKELKRTEMRENDDFKFRRPGKNRSSEEQVWALLIKPLFSERERKHHEFGRGRTMLTLK